MSLSHSRSRTSYTELIRRLFACNSALKKMAWKPRSILHT